MQKYQHVHFYSTQIVMDIVIKTYLQTYYVCLHIQNH